MRVRIEVNFRGARLEPNEVLGRAPLEAQAISKPSASSSSMIATGVIYERRVEDWPNDVMTVPLRTVVKTGFAAFHLARRL